MYGQHARHMLAPHHIKGVPVVAKERRDVERIRAAFSILQKRDHSAFRRVKNHLKMIYIASGRVYANGVYERDGVWFAAAPFLRTCPPLYLASLLVHEMHHIAEYRAGQCYRRDRSERSAYLAQRRFLITSGGQQYIRWLDEQYERRWWERTGRDSRFTKLLAKARRTIRLPRHRRV